MLRSVIEFALPSGISVVGDPPFRKGSIRMKDEEGDPFIGIMVPADELIKTYAGLINFLTLEDVEDGVRLFHFEEGDAEYTTVYPSDVESASECKHLMAKHQDCLLNDGELSLVISTDEVALLLDCHKMIYVYAGDAILDDVMKWCIWGELYPIDLLLVSDTDHTHVAGSEEARDCLFHDFECS